MTTWMQQRSLPPIKVGKPYPLFNAIQIETGSMCNRACDFCPVSSGKRKGKQKFMPLWLFTNIITQLQELLFNGRVALFMLDEPLLNPTIASQAAIVREHLPRSTIYLSTNGDVLESLGVGAASRLLTALEQSGVNSMNWNVYDVGDKGRQRRAFYESLIREFRPVVHNRKYGRVPTGKMHVCITDMSKERVDFISTDEIFPRKNSARIPTTIPDNQCPQPMRKAVVDYRGMMQLCCACDNLDPHNALADLKKENLLDAWSGEKFGYHRYQIQEHGRRHPPCNTCEFKTSYPGVFRRVKP